MNQTIRKQLLTLAEPEFQQFSSALLPAVDNILGVRLPLLRHLAKDIAQSDWRAFVTAEGDDYFEETMLQGLVLGYAKTDLEEHLLYLGKFIPKINNWALCDSFCTGLKFTRKHQEQVWLFLQPYLRSTQEYEIRFAVVMLITYYIDEAHITDIFHSLDSINHEGYYVKMAVAWALSLCYIKFPAPTMTYLHCNTLDDFTYNKTLQKITESRRVDAATKAVIRNMKRKSKQRH